MKAMSDTVKQTIIQAFKLEGWWAGGHAQPNEKGEKVDRLWVDYLWSVRINEYDWGRFSLSVIKGHDMRELGPRPWENHTRPKTWWKSHFLVYPSHDSDDFINSNPLQVVELEYDPAFDILQTMPLLPFGNSVVFSNFSSPKFSLLALTRKATVDYVYDGAVDYPIIKELWNTIFKIVATVREKYNDEQIEAQFRKWNLPLA